MSDSGNFFDPTPSLFMSDFGTFFGTAFGLRHFLCPTSAQISVPISEHSRTFSNILEHHVTSTSPSVPNHRYRFVTDPKFRILFSSLRIFQPPNKCVFCLLFSCVFSISFLPLPLPPPFSTARSFGDRHRPHPTDVPQHQRCAQPPAAGSNRPQHQIERY